MILCPADVSMLHTLSGAAERLIMHCLRYSQSNSPRACFCAVCLLAAGLVSSVGTRGTQAFILFAAGFLLVGGLFLMFYLPAVAPVHRSTSWVFTGIVAQGKQELGLPDNT